MVVKMKAQLGRQEELWELFRRQLSTCLDGHAGNQEDSGHSEARGGRFPGGSLDLVSNASFFCVIKTEQNKTTHTQNLSLKYDIHT